MKARVTPLQIIVHVGAWIPLALLVFDFFAGRLSVNPIQDLEQRTGRAAILFLVLSLACTPLNSALGWREAIKRRRALGLYTFMYAAIHMSIFLGLDYGLSWPLIEDAVLHKRYIFVGTAAFLMLIPLALTSFRSSMRSMGKNWKRLHNLVYLIAPLVVIHYAWAKKGDLFRLQGDILRPLIYGLIVVLLLTLRLPFVRRTVSSLRTRLQYAVHKKPARRDSRPTSPTPLVKNKSSQPQKKGASG